MVFIPYGHAPRSVGGHRHETQSGDSGNGYRHRHGGVLRACASQPSVFFDQCKITTIEGRVERVQWKDPHTVILVRLDDGTAYTIDWNSLNALTRDRVIEPAQAALVFGAGISV
jgi:hypothetical protein